MTRTPQENPENHNNNNRQCDKPIKENTVHLATSSLPDFFRGTVESSLFKHLGITDPAITDYTSDLLMKCIREDGQFIRDVSGSIIEDIELQFNNGQSKIGQAKRDELIKIADKALFNTGYYQLHFKDGSYTGLLNSSVHTYDRGTLDRSIIASYEELQNNYWRYGKRAYQEASNVDVDKNTSPSPSLLSKLSEQFQNIAYGLGKVYISVIKETDIMREELSKRYPNSSVILLPKK